MVAECQDNEGGLPDDKEPRETLSEAGGIGGCVSSDKKDNHPDSSHPKLQGSIVDLSSFSEKEMEPQRESVTCLSGAGWGPVLGYLSGALMSPNTVAPSFPHTP